MFASFANRWWITAASFLALMVAVGSVNIFSFAVMLKPVTQELGISRSLLAGGLLVANLACGVATPLVGLFADRWGSRRVLLAGIPLFALAEGAFSSLQTSSLWMFTLFATAGLFGAAQNTVPYSKVISKWFDDNRGLALGLATAGTGFGAAVVPALMRVMVSVEGWRTAYLGLGALIMLVAFIPVLLLVREPQAGEAPFVARTLSAAPGLELGAAVRQPRFWAIAGGYFLSVVATNGTLAHVVAILTDRGQSSELAVGALSVSGFAMVAGRVLGGWCLDRFHGPSVAFCFQYVAAAGIACLASGQGGIIPLLGTLLCGLGLGAHVGLMAFFASRYFGLRAYGTIYGLMFGLFLIGSGVGPYLCSLSFDLLHSYTPALLAFMTALIVMSFVMVRLGDYPFGVGPAPPEPGHAQEPAICRVP